MLERLECYLEYKNTDIDEAFRERKQKCQDEYEYGNEKYQILMPETAFEMCEEAIRQDNCLMGYIEEHAIGDTTILFVREKKRLEKSFVTIEVKNHQVTQVYAACNALPSIEVYEFLVEYGCKRWIY